MHAHAHTPLQNTTLRYNCVNVTTSPATGHRLPNLLGCWCYRSSDDGGLTWSAQRYNLTGAYDLADIDLSNAWGGRVLEGWSVGKPLIADDNHTVKRMPLQFPCTVAIVVLVCVFTTRNANRQPPPKCLVSQQSPICHHLLMNNALSNSGGCASLHVLDLQVLMQFTKVSTAAGRSEAFFFRSTAVLDPAEPAEGGLGFELVPPRPAQHGAPWFGIQSAVGGTAQEGSLVQLSTGTFYAVFRTTNGFMGAATSVDGVGWSGGLFALHDVVDYGAAMYLNKVSAGGLASPRFYCARVELTPFMYSRSHDNTSAPTFRRFLNEEKLCSFTHRIPGSNDCCLRHHPPPLLFTTSPP